MSEINYKNALDAAAKTLDDSEYEGLVRLCVGCVAHKGCADEEQVIASYLKKMPEPFRNIDPREFALGFTEYLFVNRKV